MIGGDRCRQILPTPPPARPRSRRVTAVQGNRGGGGDGSIALT